MAMLMPRPIAALQASLTTIIAVSRFVRSQVSIPMANSRLNEFNNPAQYCFEHRFCRQMVNDGGSNGGMVGHMGDGDKADILLDQPLSLLTAEQ